MESIYVYVNSNRKYVSQQGSHLILSNSIVHQLCIYSLHIKSLNLSTSLADPIQRAVRWSTAVMGTSNTEPPDTPSLVLPPAFSTKSPNGHASKARRSLAGLEGLVGLQK